MKERPILFSDPMVRAILDGRKTQTRRVAPIDDIRLTHHDGGILAWSVRFAKPHKRALSSHSGGRFSEDEARRVIAAMYCPYGQPGDRLWVRETWRHIEGGAVYDAAGGVMDAFEPETKYRADWPLYRGRWKPSIHMPRWASRILLGVTGVRVERLQDISEADARAEGAPCVDEVSGREALFPDADQAGSWRPGFRVLWESINGEGSWDANPWVWVVEFERVTP